MQTQEMIITKKKRVGQAEREQKLKVHTTHSEFFCKNFVLVSKCGKTVLLHSHLKNLCENIFL